MDAAADHADLVEHLERTSALGRGEAVRVVEEMLSFFSETAEDYVRRRHRELQQAGVGNREGFARIAAELHARRVAAPALSERQIRRVIYG